MNDNTIQHELMPKRSDTYVAAAEAEGLRFMNPVRWKAMDVMARTFMQSNALPSTVKNAPQLMMILQAGYEAGMQPIQAINSFYFVNGKLTMYGPEVIAQVMRAGHKVEWGHCDDKSATVKITRKDGTGSYEDTFTWEQAKARGLVNAVYTKFPNHMLKYKVFSMVAKFVCPDAIGNVQIGDSNEMVEAMLVEGIIKEKATRADQGTPTYQVGWEKPAPDAPADTAPATTGQTEGSEAPQNDPSITSQENTQPEAVYEPTEASDPIGTVVQALEEAKAQGTTVAFAPLAKLLAEQGITEKSQQHAIIRTARERVNTDHGNETVISA